METSLNTLLENHRAFLRFLERKVGDRALAEDILQETFVKVVARPDQAPPDEAVVPWFYRNLRNAAIDRYRREGASNRALEAFAREVQHLNDVSTEVRDEICACVMKLADTLKPEYAEALKVIDIDGQSVKAFAQARGLSSSNAGVRVFRAREALRKRVKQSCGLCAEHGCTDCSCGR